LRHLPGHLWIHYVSAAGASACHESAGSIFVSLLVAAVIVAAAALAAWAGIAAAMREDTHIDRESLLLGRTAELGDDDL
jgi:hypothetical protein